MSIEGKVALVTGSIRGIDLAILMKLAMNGADVVGTATTQAGADAITEALKAMNLKGRGAVLDVGDDSSIAALFQRLKSEELKPSILIYGRISGILVLSCDPFFEGNFKRSMWPSSTLS